MSSKVGKNEESCYSCKFMETIISGVSKIGDIESEFESSIKIPVCSKNQIDFVDELGLDDSAALYDKVTQLRTGAYVAIGNSFYEISPANDSYIKYSATENDPQEALRLVSYYGIAEVTEEVEKCPGAVRCELLLHGIPVGFLNNQTISVDDYEKKGDETISWEKSLPKDDTIRYIYKGSQWEAIVLPYLRSHGCTEGVNKKSKISFSSFSEDYKIKRLAKELWGNDLLIQAIESNVTLVPCSECGFPNQKERTLINFKGENLNYCIWCAEDLENYSLSSSEQKFHNKYMKTAKSIFNRHVGYKEAVIKIDSSPMEVAKTMKLKLYSFFKATRQEGRWNGF